jgi:thiol-disulfide isomerase/thioredoxin
MITSHIKRLFPARGFAHAVVLRMLLACTFAATTVIEDVGVARAAGVAFSDYGEAPEIAGIEQWLNSAPLSLAGLRGQVVLIDFWTYSCINCLRTLPYVARWYDKFRDRGLVVIGVHTPEFGYEKLTRNVQFAIGRNGIKYPVAQDNHFATWKAYDNQYWPAVYLIDRRGHVVLKHVGEGAYDETERAIEALISNTAEAGK